MYCWEWESKIDYLFVCFQFLFAFWLLGVWQTWNSEIRIWNSFFLRPWQKQTLAAWNRALHPTLAFSSSMSATTCLPDPRYKNGISKLKLPLFVARFYLRFRNKTLAGLKLWSTIRIAFFSSKSASMCLPDLKYRHGIPKLKSEIEKCLTLCP